MDRRKVSNDAGRGCFCQKLSEIQYQRELEDRGILDIVRYGIAFSGKNAEVRTAGTQGL